MSRKHDSNQHNTPSLTEPTQVEQVNDSLGIQELSNRDQISASQMRNLQQRAGNRALLDALATPSGGAELEAQQDHAVDEKDTKRTSTQPRSTSERAHSSASMAQGGAFWDLLLGGEDDNPDEPASPKPRAHLRRRRPWLPSKQDGGHTASQAQSLTQSPQRPTKARRGQRFFYAMDAWCEDLEQWVNPDSSAESLIELPRFHPLCRIHRSAEFWRENGQLQSSRAIAKSIQTEAGNMGHCAQIARGLGLLDLLQAVEAELLPPQQVADATAIVLQESAFGSITEIAENSEHILTTDRLFRIAVEGEKGDFSATETTLPHPHRAYPILSAALRYSIPPVNPAPILWSPDDDTPPPDEDPIIAQVDALLKTDKEPRIDVEAPRRDARQLLHDCARLRLLLASAGLALWRTCATEHAGPIKHVLKKADHQLRRCALDIAQCMDRLEPSSAETLRQSHRLLVDARSRIQHIEEETQQVMISLCQAQSTTSTSTASFCDASLARDIQNLETSQSTNTAHDPDSIALTRLYFSSLRDQESPSFATLCKQENNPWLWIRAETERLKNTPTCPTPDADENANLEKEDRLAVRLWTACLRELGRI